MTFTTGNYGKLSASIEYCMPFDIAGKRSGAYFFISAEDSDHYYNDIYNKGVLVQAAFDTEISDSVLLEYGFMAQ
ncbi:MAG: hypothetical protein J6386_16660 [Candidatus Synoicihabitans palmerolidicus]|nr:hypothetical protein [Candidatus Synoicihabitans palmerolidicus]